MRKMKYILVAAALAALAIPSVASADVARCTATVADPSQPVPMTFSVTHPRENVGQWDKTWEHTFTGTIVPATGAFSAEGYEFNGQEPFLPATSAHETVNGTYNAAANTMSFDI